MSDIDQEAEEPTEELSGDEAPKSKSQLKREMTALQEMGEELVKLTPNQLAKIPLDENLRQEILKAQSMKKFGALKRQHQYIGRLMRSIETDAIEQALDRMKSHNAEDSQRFHRLEKLRDQLINSGDDSINQVVDVYPAADRQHLRQLLRQIQKETDQQKPPSASRKLFRYLRELDENK